MQATVPFLVESVFSPLQTFSVEKPFPALQLNIFLRLLLSLALKPRWLVLFLPVHDEGELRSHQLVGGVGMAHLPTLVFPMEGA